MIESGAQFWIMDEFAATLDREHTLGEELRNQLNQTIAQLEIEAQTVGFGSCARKKK
jgi:hypothetical protein